MPQVLQTTYRLIEQSYSKEQLKFTVKGPAQNNCVARIILGDFKILKVEATVNGRKRNVDYKEENKTDRQIAQNRTHQAPSCNNG